MRILLPFAAAGLAAVLHPTPARACGGLIQVDTGTVSQSGQVSLLVIGESTTDVVLTLDVGNAANAFGVLVPVPGEPTIDDTPVSTDDLALLEEQTRPAIFASPDDGGGPSCGCAPQALSGDAANSRGVIVGDAVAIGPVTAQWVSGADGAAVSDWLTQEGFVLPAGAQALLDDYIADGLSFLAFTRNETSTGEARVGVHFTLAGAHPAYALKMTRLGAAPSLSFTILVATADPDGVGPDAPYTALTVDQLDQDLIAADDYKGAVTKGVSAVGGRAFVVETKLKMGEAFGSSLLGGIIPADHTVTRLSTIADPANLDTDVTFTEKAPTNLRPPVALADASPPPSSSSGPGSTLEKLGADGAFWSALACVLVVFPARRRVKLARAPLLR